MDFKQIFHCQVCRVWKGPCDTPLVSIIEAEEEYFEEIHGGVYISWIPSSYVGTEDLMQSSYNPGMYIVRSTDSIFNSSSLYKAITLNEHLYIPNTTIQLFHIYYPSLLTCNLLVNIQPSMELNGNAQQSQLHSQECFFFGELTKCMPEQRALQSSRCDFYSLNTTDNIVFALESLHSSFPSALLTQEAAGMLLNSNAKKVKRMRLGSKLTGISSTSFYGDGNKSPSSHKTGNDSWKEFYSMLKFRVSQSRLCQLEGTAPLSSIFPRQAEAFQFLDQLLAFRKKLSIPANQNTADRIPPRVFSMECAKQQGKRKFIVISQDEFWRQYMATMESERHMYEIIRENTPCRLYFDLEYDRSLNLHVNGNDLVQRLIHLVQIQLYRKFQIHLSNDDIIQLDSTTDKKFSRHLIFHFPNGELFADNSHVGAFVYEFVNDLILEFPDSETINEHADEKLNINPILMQSQKKFSIFFVNTAVSTSNQSSQQLFIDTGVYTRNRMFRVLGSTKYKKNAILKLHETINNGAKSNIDLSSFLKTLVCPWDIPHDNKLLYCKHHKRSTVRWNNMFKFDASRLSCVDEIQESLGKSMFPELDAFIIMQCRHDGIQGVIRSCQAFYSTQGNNKTVLQENNEINSQIHKLPHTLRYHMSQNRYCYNIKRQHKSNNIILVVDLIKKLFYQMCHDPQCKAIGYRSAPKALPLSIDLTTHSDSCDQLTLNFV